MTNDYSVGLYDEEVNDIYHSAFGALTEAYEKFANALNLIDTKNIRVLDICYGIGYNSKVLINEYFKSNNILNIDCVDTNKTLIEISPFISSYIPFYKRFLYKDRLTKNISNYSEAKKISNIKTPKNIYKIFNDVNYIILENLLNQNFNDRKYDYLSNESKNILLNHENRPFFDDNMLNFYKFLSKTDIDLYQIKNKSTFVHNIYYSYISNRYNMWKNNSNFNNITLNFFNNDIRTFLKQASKPYDLIFLDGFTPAKCPCIWTLDIFKELYNKLSNDGVLSTYNSSAAVRNAMINAGFYIGNAKDENNKTIGTVASKNINLIKNRLSEAELGLLNTKAGIPYRDESLTLDNDIILLNRKKEVEKSVLQASSSYLKGLKL